MNRFRGLAAVLALLGIGACGSLGHTTAPRSVSDFGPPVEALAKDIAWPHLAVEVRAPAWFDSPGITYRLAYADARELHAYAATRWAGTPTLLVAQRLRQRLHFGPPAAGACRVVVTLDEFSQIFDTPASSRGVVRGSLSLSDRRGAVLAQTALRAEAVSASADARGGVAALAEAVDGTAATIAQWLVDPAQKDTLNGCRDDQVVGQGRSR